MRREVGKWLAGGAVALAAVVTCASTGNALPVTVDAWTCVTADPTNCATATGAAEVVISESGSLLQLHLTYSATAGVISEFYIDDDAGVLAALSSISNGPGVDFVSGATPVDLPGGNGATPPFHADATFSAEASAPPSAEGIANGEFADIFYNLAAGKSFADVEAAILAGTLRFGEHIISLPCNTEVIGCTGTTSVSIVSGGEPPPPHITVAEPATLALLGVSLAGLGLIRRKRAA